MAETQSAETQSAPLAVQKGAEILRDAGLAGDSESGAGKTKKPDAASVEKPSGESKANSADVMADALESILAGKNPADTEGGEVEKPGQEGTASSDAGALTSLASVADKLGIDIAALYEVEIPMPDGGDSIKLSELKDIATAHKRGELERLDFDTQVSKERNAMTQARLELQEMVGMLPATARTPEMLQEAKRRMEAARVDNAREILERVPEWKDRAVFEADAKTIVEHISDFGFSTEDWGNIVDARLQAYVRHNALREQRLTAIIAKARGKKIDKSDNRTGGGNKPLPDTKKRIATQGQNARQAQVEAAKAILGKG